MNCLKEVNMDVMQTCEEYEYGNPRETDFQKLNGDEAIAVLVPSDLILDKEFDPLRLALYSYFYVNRGKRNELYVSIEELLNFMNKQSNRHKGGINHRVLDTIRHLKEIGYINYDDYVFVDGYKNDPTRSIWYQFFKVKFMDDFVMNEISERPFTCIYYDEVLNIMNNRNEDKPDKYAKNTQTLLLFSYLRWRIGKRPNKIKESLNSQDYIEAFNCYYDEITNDIGLKNSMIVECVKILENIGLIKHEKVCKKFYPKSMKNAVYANTVIFVNAYKREGKVLLTSGEEYYSKEIEKKKEKILHFGGFSLN